MTEHPKIPDRWRSTPEERAERERRDRERRAQAIRDHRVHVDARNAEISACLGARIIGAEAFNDENPRGGWQGLRLYLDTGQILHLQAISDGELGDLAASLEEIMKASEEAPVTWRAVRLYGYGMTLEADLLGVDLLDVRAPLRFYPKTYGYANLYRDGKASGGRSIGYLRADAW